MTAPAHDRGFQTLVDAWLITLPSAGTRSAYGRDLAAFVVWLGARGIHPYDAGEKALYDYRTTHEAEAVSSATIQRRLSSVASFYRFAVLSREVAENPTGAPRNLPAKARSSTARLSGGEVAALWDASLVIGPRTAVLVGLLLFDGLKLFEVLEVDVGSVMRDAGKCYVNISRRGHGLAVELDARTADQVHRLRRGRQEGPLLVGESVTVNAGLRLSRFGADYLLKQAGARAGLATPLTANQLRSTHISVALKRTGDPESVRRSVGHVDRRSTLRFR